MKPAENPLIRYFYDQALLEVEAAWGDRLAELDKGVRQAIELAHVAEYAVAILDRWQSDGSSDAPTAFILDLVVYAVQVQRDKSIADTEAEW